MMEKRNVSFENQAGNNILLNKKRKTIGNNNNNNNVSQVTNALSGLTALAGIAYQQQSIPINQNISSLPKYFIENNNSNNNNINTNKNNMNSNLESNLAKILNSNFLINPSQNPNPLLTNNNNNFNNNNFNINNNNSISILNNNNLTNFNNNNNNNYHSPNNNNNILINHQINSNTINTNNINNNSNNHFHINNSHHTITTTTTNTVNTVLNNTNINNNPNNNNTNSEIERLKILKLELLNQLEEKRRKKEIFQFTPIELFAVQEISPSSSGQMYMIVSLSKQDAIQNYPNLTRIENISSNLSTSFGYDQKDMIGSNLGKFYPEIKEENMNPFREEIIRVCSTKPVTFLRTKEFVKHRNGDILTLNSNCAIFSGDNGKPSILLSFVKSISHDRIEERDLIPKFEIITEKK